MIAVSPGSLETPGPLLLLAGQPGGRVLSPKIGRDRRFISLGRELGGKAAQDFTKRHPSLGFDWLRHVLEHGAADDRKPGEAFLESGEVCRERGH